LRGFTDFSLVLSRFEGDFSQQNSQKFEKFAKCRKTVSNGPLHKENSETESAKSCYRVIRWILGLAALDQE
jgi:hypothetical protein